MVFRGTYEYAIDGRGRLPIPARYRDAFADGVILVQGLEGCVEIYTPSGYEAWASFLTKEKPNRQRGRRLRRRFFGGSMDAELDRQGRLLVPPLLREHAGLSRTVLMIGRDECLEIWSPDRWEAEHALADEAYEAALESLEERA